MGLNAGLKVIAATAALLVSAATDARGGFDGLWVADLGTQTGQAGFDIYLVADGVYRCTTCRPPRAYPADGRLRAVPGDSAGASEAVSITGPRTMVTRISTREMVRRTTMTVSPDGTLATYVSLDMWPGRRVPLRTEYVARRTAPAPDAAHPVSGSWVGIRYVAVPEEYRSIRLTDASGTFTRVDFRRGRYTAKIGGPPAPVTGDGKNIFTATVTAPDRGTRIETVSLKGKPLVERTYSLSDDGELLITTVRDPADGSVFTSTSRRK